MTKQQSRLRLHGLILILLAVILGGCATEPSIDSPGGGVGAEASRIAVSMVGKPYRYGGYSPAKGFDCSGLVYFSFKRAGINVPRSTHAQRKQSRKVSGSHLSRGDLLFFDQEGKSSSHVGIYLGNNRFVHAPSSGKRVRVDTFTDSYWQHHFVDARRF